MSVADSTRSEIETAIAAEMRLRPDPPRVVRLSRRVLGTGAAVVALALGAVLLVALQTREGEAPTELYRTDNPPTADELTQLPRDYSDIPRLGPPLPGDLGRPILRTQEQGAPITPPVIQPQPLDPAEQARRAEMEAARTSSLFARTSGGGTAPAPSIASGPSATAFPDLAGQQPQSEPTATERRQAFLDAPVDRRVVSPDRVAPPASPFLLQAGTIIPAALMTGLRSDLPGQITAQVTQAVYDSPTGRYLLVPQGARLIGTYDAEIGAGQRRVLVVWTRLILPGGRSIVLERLPGADRQGYAGLQDRVEDNWGGAVRAAGLATLIALAGELGRDDEDEIAEAIRESGQQTIGRIGEQVVQRELDVPPVISIRPGTPVRVIVTRDLVLEPLRE
ncbi:TrbI/VirB10 family protein [Aestuariibius insulae]|uniref:TrbI/VirB10 family protein n=1 Tax=Aestuariibius insulae TaxID=2058287 RepID=UPI00345EA7A2